MVTGKATGQVKPIKPPGTERSAPRPVNSLGNLFFLSRQIDGFLYETTTCNADQSFYKFPLIFWHRTTNQLDECQVRRRA